ncbi:MAG: poly-gamma-glutamate hydrolase family protein [Bdellovibrionales bacterium]|nr:poly-gamma-glutamate hydrolase family protein [Bdellovibrionales bacterium]
MILTQTKNALALLPLIFGFACQDLARRPEVAHQPQSRNSAPKEVHSFSEMTQYYTEGTDFKITVLDRGSSTTILAPHGGKTEPGTFELAAFIAGNDLNLYGLEAIVHPIHLTATKFDEPQALALTAKSKNCLATHQFLARTPQSPDVCVGGANQQLAQKINDLFVSLGFTTEFPCVILPGTSPKNIVNRCANQGVQLEFRADRMDVWMKDAAITSAVVQGLREIVNFY